MKVGFYLLLSAMPMMTVAQAARKANAITPVKGSVKPLALNSEVRMGRLANGFTYYIQKNVKPEKRVTFYLANKVGSILETDEQQGLAHFLEHMNFNGTTNFPKNELISYLQGAGVRFGADLNAYTSFDETVYMLPIATDKPEILANGLKIMRDWAHGALLDSEDIDKERGVILEEKRMGKGASERMREKTFPVMLNGSRYASRLPIGNDAVLTSFKPETIRRFYDDWYRPNLQALIVVGDIEVAAMEASIKKMFADLKNPANPKPRPAYQVPLLGKPQFLVVTDREFPQTVAQVTFKLPGKVIKTGADYREKITEGLINMMFLERLGDLMQVADPAFLGGGASKGSFISNLDAFSAQVSAKPGQLERGFKALWTELEKARKFGFSEAELQRAKTSYLTRIELSWKEKDKTPSNIYVNEYLQHFLKGEAAPGIDVEYQLVKEFLPGISRAELNALIKRYLAAKDRDVIVMGPEKDKASLPDEATVNAWIKSVEQSNITANEKETNATSLMASKPQAGKVVSEKRIQGLGVTELTLSNGIKVVLKPTDFNNNQILFTAFSPGGTSLVSDADYHSAANAQAIVASSGLAGLNATQLPKVLNGKVVSVSPYISERSEGLSGSTRWADLETALQLSHLYFTKPRMDTTTFKGIVARAKASLANRDSDPGNVFSDTISVVLGNYHRRRTPPSIAQVEQINLETVYRVYKDRFADASDFTFIFVGNFEEENIKPLLAQYLGSLPTLQRKEAPKDLGIHIPEGKINKVVYKGTENKASVYMVLSGAYQYSPENNVKLEALKEVINFRLLERLRESEGGVYTPGIRVAYSKYPQARYSFNINFDCAPENREKLIAAAIEEIELLKKNGPSAADLQKFVAEERSANETALKTNNFWLGYLNKQYQYEVDMTEVLHYQGLLKSLTPEAIKAAAVQYLTGKNLITFSLLPESEAKK